MTEYQETIDFLFTQVPMFQKVGAGAYKPGLQTVKTLSAAFGNPHTQFPAIHVGGTNGKGSTAHTLAAVLQSAGYKVGLFTSPHLLDFRERIKVDGQMISEGDVVDFVKNYRRHGLDIAPSFFELTTVMAFDHFARMNVDVAVIEVGLGGRLDSTNIITPKLSVITNISFDHVALLGDTLPQIAFEKAGIIKDGVPVVVGEAPDREVRNVFVQKAESTGSTIVFADDAPRFSSATDVEGGILYKDTAFGDITGELSGECQRKNTATILCALEMLRDMGWSITRESVSEGFANVVELTGLMGRWMKLSSHPDVICDTGHNTGGWDYLAGTLSGIKDLKMVIGFVNDKDVTGILAMMPRNAEYYFTRASVDRALSEDTLGLLGREAGLRGDVYPTVAEAMDAALDAADENSTIFVGGSTFVVADLLSYYRK